VPIKEHGFAFNKGEFKDVICLHYAWSLVFLPSHCICGHNLTIVHALNRKCGGCPSIRHNELVTLLLIC
uniref:Uncharacterized protein n=1 Tax=Amphimedon queenslandica TaxID=400682 RepID=A0A1X7UCB9_AMPQE